MTSFQFPYQILNFKISMFKYCINLKIYPRKFYGLYCSLLYELGQEQLQEISFELSYPDFLILIGAGRIIKDPVHSGPALARKERPTLSDSYYKKGRDIIWECPIFLFNAAPALPLRKSGSYRLWLCRPDLTLFLHFQYSLENELARQELEERAARVQLNMQQNLGNPQQAIRVRRQRIQQVSVEGAASLAFGSIFIFQMDGSKVIGR